VWGDFPQKSQPSQNLKLSQPQSAAVVTTPAVPRGHEGGGCVPPFLRRVARLCILHPGALFGNTFHKFLVFFAPTRKMKSFPVHPPFTPPRMCKWATGKLNTTDARLPRIPGLSSPGGDCGRPLEVMYAKAKHCRPGTPRRTVFFFAAQFGVVFSRSGNFIQITHFF